MKNTTWTKIEPGQIVSFLYKSKNVFIVINEAAGELASCTIAKCKKEKISWVLI